MTPATGPGDEWRAAWNADMAALPARYGPALRRFFGRRVPPADIDDMVQNVFLRMHAAAPRDGVAKAETYLFKIARTVMIDRYRSVGLRGDIDLPLSEDDPLPVDELSPERILIARDDCERVHRAIRALPPRARAAFQMHRFDNLSYPEIARVMGVSRDRVKELMRRAIAGIAASRRLPGDEQ